jgi:hypothetical protein
MVLFRTVYAQRSSGLLPEYRLLRLNGNMLLMLGQREYNIYKVKRNILGQEVIRVLAKTVGEINLQTLNKVMVIMVV